MIRPATHNDVPALIQLALGFFENGELDGTGLETDADTVEFLFRDMLDMETHTVFVAEVDGKVVGGIAGGVQPWMFNADILVLHELGWFIPKENRGKYPMAAMSLRKKFHQWGRDRGATVLIMSSTEREESPRVIQFYKDSGLRLMDHNFVGRL